MINPVRNIKNSVRNSKISNGVKLIATFFYLGYIPLFPGTLGSLVGLGIYLFIARQPFLYIIILFILIALGFFSSGKTERLLDKKDPPPVIIDEIGGMLIALLFLPFRIEIVIIGFILYRLIDILKPYPLRRVQKLSGSAGIMLDDILAGIYTNLLLQLWALRFVMCRAW